MRLDGNHRWIVLLLVQLALGVMLCTFLCSCAMQPPAQKQTSATKEEPYRFETEGKIPPLEDSDIIEETDFEEVPVTEEEVFEEEVELPPVEIQQGSPTEAAEKVDGFRIQVYATGNDETAEAVRDAAEQKLGLPAYVELIEGLYKVRIGDCHSREEAEALRQRCRDAGYGDAWIVETLVLAAPK